jgi:quercetin dioxygenase-like cupin family protein
MYASRCAPATSLRPRSSRLPQNEHRATSRSPRHSIVEPSVHYDRAVKITSHSEALQGQPLDPSHFTGPASSHPLHEADGHAVRVSVVRFEPGVRNYWHRHAGGQVLHVIEGEGYVQRRGEPPRRIRSGDIVVAEPEEEHWHGATAEGPMAHVAISIGAITWLESSANEPA